MILSLLLRHGGWAALVATCGASVACSSSTTPPPAVFINASMGIGSMSDQIMCPIGSRVAWLTIGTALPGLPTTVNDGGQDRNGNVSVNCSVHPNGNAFDVNLSAVEDGPQGASLTITGKGVTASGGKASAVFASPSQGRYTESDCTITYTYNMDSTPQTPPIAAGRAWGHISCPVSQAAGQTFTGADGGAQTRQCDAEADFLFQQCGQ